MHRLTATDFTFISFGDTDHVNTALAYFRLYTTISATGGQPPRMLTPGGDLVQLEFEGNATDERGHATSFPGATYSTTAAESATTGVRASGIRANGVRAQ